MASMLTGMQPSVNTLFSAYASFAGTMMMLRTIANDIIPRQLRAYILSLFSSFISLPPKILTIVIEETCGFSNNQVYQAAELYLPTKINPSTQRIKVGKVERQKNLTVTLEKGEKIEDVYDGVHITWTYVSSSADDKKKKEEKYFEVRFDKKHRDKVLSFYLPHVLSRAKEIKDQDKVVKLYSRDCGRDVGENGGWGSINLEHPATFDKLAMDAELKKAIIDDLDRFVRRREFYKKVGKAWKRGYLLYGPPGTGKSSLIACMANYLKFDIYDVELSSMQSNRDFKRVLLGTSNRSIIVIEDIDCTVEAQDRKQPQQKFFGSEHNPKLTLSGLLNFIDGLWSSCGDERIIVFTTNHKDRLDPALLRPGRMDMHIKLSYCTPCGFKILASNYLDVKVENRLCEEIERLLEDINVTPAEVAEELMRSDDPEVALGGLIECLKRKKIESETIEHQTESVCELKDYSIGSNKEMTEITYAI